ncbi:sulfotransferase 2B1-like [Clarias gariepinus]|uniref:sulfotransferase 2B1-like n=1 Tax=Clarias gariepinus TaxID=13013 RepID=UPI00234D6C07|nr:sulfotransferase 2B1-like [Clarias gariepinus]
MASNELYLFYHGLLLPKISHTGDSLKCFESFQMQDDDVVVVTYPKSGTTWMQEILPLLMNGGDFSKVLTIPNWDRVPWLEELRIAEVVDKLTPPRAFVSHMPYHLMPPSFFSSKAKVIYVSRNPKDVIVSSFNFHQMASFLHDPGTFEEFMDSFLSGNVLFGKWTDHVKSWRNTDLGDRILYITYEEMIKDLSGVIERILSFLGKNMNKETLKRVSEHCEFKSMKQNNMSNYSLVPQDIMDHTKCRFLRKGIVGDWKNYFTPELESKFNAVIFEELKGTDITVSWDGAHN